MSSIEMHVGNAGRAPFFRMRSSTSSATSSSSTPSPTSATARSRASREIRPARRRDSRTSGSIGLGSRRQHALPKDLGPFSRQIHDGRLAAEGRRSPVDVQVDAVSELALRVRTGHRGSRAVAVRAARGDGTVRLREEPGDRMGWYAKGDSAVFGDNGGGGGGGGTQERRGRARGGFWGETPPRLREVPPLLERCGTPAPARELAVTPCAPLPPPPG